MKYKKAFVPNLESLWLGKFKRFYRANILRWLCIPAAKQKIELKLQETHLFMKIQFSADTKSTNFIIFVLRNSWVVWSDMKQWIEPKKYIDKINERKR